jgi:hypothetical protein
MTTLTVKVSGKKQARLLYEMLNSIKFVKQVEMNDSDDWDKDEKEILDERLKEFQKNPKAGRTLDDLVTKITRKYGIKNNN